MKRVLSLSLSRGIYHQALCRHCVPTRRLLRTPWTVPALGTVEGTAGLRSDGTNPDATPLRITTTRTVLRTDDVPTRPIRHHCHDNYRVGETNRGRGGRLPPVHDGLWNDLATNAAGTGTPGGRCRLVPPRRRRRVDPGLLRDTTGMPHRNPSGDAQRNDTRTWCRPPRSESRRSCCVYQSTDENIMGVVGITSNHTPWPVSVLRRQSRPHGHVPCRAPFPRQHRRLSRIPISVRLILRRRIPKPIRKPVSVVLKLAPVPTRRRPGPTTVTVRRTRPRPVSRPRHRI